MSVEQVRLALAARSETEALPAISAHAAAAPPAEALDFARAALKRRWHRAAIVLAARGMEAAPVEALLAMADSQLALRDWDGARRSAEAALAARGPELAALMRLVRALRGGGDLPAAAAAARKWTARMPKSADAWAETARIAALRGDDGEALSAAGRACDLRPADEEMRTLALASAERRDAAPELTRHALALAKRNPRMLGRLAAAWVRMGKPAAAATLCEALIETLGPVHEARRDVTLVCGLMLAAAGEAGRPRAQARVDALAARLRG